MPARCSSILVLLFATIGCGGSHAFGESTDEVSLSSISFPNRSLAFGAIESNTPLIPSGFELIWSDRPDGCGYWIDATRETLPTFLEVEVLQPHVGSCPVVGARAGEDGPQFWDLEPGGPCRARAWLQREFVHDFWGVGPLGGEVRIDTFDGNRVQGQLELRFPVGMQAEAIVTEEWRDIETGELLWSHYYCECKDVGMNVTTCERDGPDGPGCCNVGKEEETLVLPFDVPFCPGLRQTHFPFSLGDVGPRICQPPAAAPDCRAACEGIRRLCLDYAASVCGEENAEACLPEFCPGLASETCEAECALRLGWTGVTTALACAAASVDLEAFDACLDAACPVAP